MVETAIKIENLKKKYRLGAIGGGTLRADLQSWWARKRGKEDPNTKIGQEIVNKNETFWALNGINLEVKKGEALGIIGANGAGKSTLLKILSRVTAPTEGDVYINGRIASMLEVGTGFHPEMTGRENIYMNGAILGMTRKEVDAKMDDIIEFSECGQFIDTPVKRYSSGMYVKLAFSVAAHLDSEIMILDEVLAVGDVSFQRKCLERMRNIAKKENRTVLYVSHNMDTIRQLCDKCIVLNKGRIIYQGNSEEAIDIYINKVVKMLKYNDLTFERNDPEITGDVKIESLEVINRENNYIVAGEKIEFCLRFKLLARPKNLFIRFTIMDIGRTPVATTVSENIFEKNFYDNCICKVDISILAPGKYVAQIVLFEITGKGIQKRHDYVPQAIAFEVITSEGKFLDFDWNINWGKVALPNIELRK